MGRAVSADELEHILQHVAGRPFPSEMQVISARAAGLDYGGRTLRHGDRLPADEQHYVKHVLAHGEWPAGTTLQGYLSSVREVALDSTAGYC